MRYLIFALSFLLISSISSTKAQGSFFETLYDIPIMEGLVEIPEEALDFDKPDGRISQAVAYGENLEKGDIQTFYNQTLTQMGWAQESDGIYLREQEKLLISIEKIGKDAPLSLQVKFQLMPQ